MHAVLALVIALQPTAYDGAVSGDPMILRVAVFLVGALGLVWTVRSAIRTVVVPRGERVLLTRLLFGSFRTAYRTAARRHRDAERRHAVMSRYAPMTTMVLAGVWAVGVIVSFGLMYWSMLDLSLIGALELSGSSFTTLGFASTESEGTLGFVILEAIMGLGIVALLISYMPTIYGHFSRREELVLKFEVMGGAPPTPETFLVRLHAIGWNERRATIWEQWENWFEQVQESHTSQPALPFLRSQNPDTSWITTAGAVLDTIAITESALDLPHEYQCALTLRAGFTALGAIARFYGAPVPTDPASDDPISVTRAEFDHVVDRLVADGVPVRADRDAAWRAFAGWRVNYDLALLALCELCDAPEAVWSSDRSAEWIVPPTMLHPRRWRLLSPAT